MAASATDSSYEDSMPVTKNQLSRNSSWNLKKGTLCW